MTAVVLALGTGSILLSWAVPPPLPRFSSDPEVATIGNLATQQWKSIEAWPRTQVKGRNQLVDIDVDHTPPGVLQFIPLPPCPPRAEPTLTNNAGMLAVLVGEQYAMQVIVTNREAVPIRSCVIDLRLRDQGGATAFAAGSLSSSGKTGTVLSLEIGGIDVCLLSTFLMLAPTCRQRVAFLPPHLLMKFLSVLVCTSRPVPRTVSQSFCTSRRHQVPVCSAQ